MKYKNNDNDFPIVFARQGFIHLNQCQMASLVRLDLKMYSSNEFDPRLFDERWKIAFVYTIWAAILIFIVKRNLPPYFGCNLV